MRATTIQCLLCIFYAYSYIPTAYAEALLAPISESTTLSSLSSVVIKQFVFVGNKAISDSTLQKIVDPYQNRRITATELQTLRLRLSKFYAAKGYINSGVFITDQAVIDGRIVLNVIEGRVQHIHVHGQNKLKDTYISDYLQRYAQLDGILNMHQLQQALKLLKKDPRIKAVHARIEPSAQLGQALLDVQIEEENPWHASMVLNNQGAPSLGTWRANMHIENLNLMGNADRLALDYSLAAGLKNYNVNYQRPLNAARSMLILQASSSYSLVVSQAFKALNIRSHAQVQRITLEHPFFLNNHYEFSMSLAYQHKSNFTSLLGVPFSFSKGVRNGLISTHSFLFAQTWAYHTPTRVMAIQSELTVGTSPNIRQGVVMWLGQTQWIEAWSLWHSQSVVRAHTRWSNRDLLAVDTFAIGGRNSVRGYRENQLTLDNAAAFSWEWRIPIFQLAMPYISQRPADGQVMLATFFDYAHAWNKQGNLNAIRYDLASVGLGLRWQLSQAYQFEIYVAKPFQKVNRDGRHNLQDSGIHMQLSAQVL